MIGSLNPCPFRAGGGPTPSSKTYSTMHRAVGVGGSALDDRGLDGLWRRSRAKGVAAADSSLTRAVLNWFPILATDALPSFGRILNLIQAVDESETEFRRRVWAAWVVRQAVDTPSLLAQLQMIDSRFSLSVQSESATTQFGKAFSSDAGADWGLSTNETLLPNYSTDFVIFVEFALGYPGTPRSSDQRAIAQARELLLAALPSWVDFSISISQGFHVGSSPIGRVGL